MKIGFGKPQRDQKWLHILRNLHLGLYNWLLTHIPSYTIRHFILRVFYGLKLGKHSTIEMGVRFYSPQKITIGDYSVVHYDSILDGRQHLHIGNCVDIGIQVNIFTLQHDLDDPNYGGEGGKVTIQDYAVISARSTILPGKTIAEGGVVATGAVVAKDVAPYTVVGGVPAKRIRERNRDLKYRLDVRIWCR